MKVAGKSIFLSTNSTFKSFSLKEGKRKEKDKWKGVFCVARALYDNEAESPDELQFRTGDCLTVLEQNTTGLQGWWLCSLRGRQGVCPANRVRLVPGLYDIPGRGITQLEPQYNRNTNKVVVPQKLGDGYIYDTPINLAVLQYSSRYGPPSQDGSFDNQSDYDVPRAPVAVQSLNGDSKRESQEYLSYDVPRPNKNLLEAEQVCYDIPKSYKSVEGESYDIPKPYQQEKPAKVMCDTYDIPKPSETYDVPQSHLTINNDSHYNIPKSVPEVPRNCRVSILSSGSPALSPSSSTSSLSLSSAEPNYDIPRPYPTRVITAAPEGVYDVPPQPSRDGGADRLSFGSSRDSRELDLSSLGCALPEVTRIPLELNSAIERNEKLKEEVYSAASKLLNLGSQLTQSLGENSENLRVAAVRMRDTLTEYCNFARGALVNASEADSNLGQRMSRQLRPLLDACTIITKTVTAFDKGQETCLTLDQLLACTRHVPEDIRQVASFIQGNSTLLFQKTVPLIPMRPKDQMDGQTLIEDYDYVGIEPELELSENDKKVLNYYSKQAEEEFSHFDKVMEQFFLSVKNNQPPREFVSQEKQVMVSAQRLIYVGETVQRNIKNKTLQSTFLKLSENLIRANGNAVQSTKKAATRFPHVQAVQQMVDSMVEVSNCAREIKVELSRSGTT